jgi:chorismate mutase/prephenate dehydratase
LKLLTSRAVFAKKIGQFKTAHGEEFYLPHREKNIIMKIVADNPGPLSDEAIENIYREILHSCRSLQARLKVAYLGPEATFTHLAAMKNFGKYTDYMPAKAISDVFKEVEKSRADYGVVPIENSTEGVVNHTLDMFIESDIKICAEINLSIGHCLLTGKEVKKLSDIKYIYSHRQALAQCRNWLETHLPAVKISEFASTAVAAQMVKKTKSTAAVASQLAAELYGLNIIAKNIEDLKENYTRFLVIGQKFAQKSGHDKTSVMFSVKDRVGALHDMLVPFKTYNINLTKIESRPTKKKAWEYIFFVDFMGHIEDKTIQKALNKLEEQCIFMKVLGSYPQAE